MISLTCGAAIAQTAVNSGLVRWLTADSTGAVIANATITLISRATGTAATRTSNSAGIFVFPAQPVGRYSVEIKADGFRSQVVNGVDVQASQATSVNVRLQPGTGSESVTVIGESPLLRT